VLFQRNATYFDPVFREAVTARRRGRMAAHRWWASACMRDSDVVVVPSNAMGQLVAPYAGSTPIRVVHHGFDAAEWRRWSLGDPPAGIERWEGADVRLLFVSQPYRQKDVPLLADTLLALRRRGVDAHLAVTFDADDPSPGAREFDRRCSVHGVSDAVTHLGAVSQQHAAALMCRASVLLYPSISESFGFPLLEAQAVDLPVVATDIPSTLEIGGPCVLTHPPRDAAAAADEVQRAITRDERGAAEARSWVERFSWDAHCRQVYEIIREVGN
jgi:glycosyltransferase involved in cell wall biosynthesis